MNHDEFIRMARDAGFQEGWTTLCAENFERFAALVAAAEREACAKLCDERAEAWRAVHLAGQRAMQTRAEEVTNKIAERILAANTHQDRTSFVGSFASGVAEDIGCDIRALEVKPS